jgi:hypothetical protein
VKRIKEVFVGLSLSGVLLAGRTGSMDRFVSGEASLVDQFGPEGPILLGIGCIAIVFIYLLLIWIDRRHRQIAGELDAIEEQVRSQEVTDDDA